MIDRLIKVVFLNIKGRKGFLLSFSVSCQLSPPSKLELAKPVIQPHPTPFYTVKVWICNNVFTTRRSFSWVARQPICLFSYIMSTHAWIGKMNTRFLSLASLLAIIVALSDISTANDCYRDPVSGKKREFDNCRSPCYWKNGEILGELCSRGPHNVL